MELSDLRIFRTVVQAGGVIRAAERLHRVQSNISSRIKMLEEKLGVTLFVREGKRMQLSPSGQILLGYAERLLALADEVHDALQEDAGPRGVLRLGAMESTAAARLPAPLGEFHARHPEVAVELHTGDPRHLTAQVLAGELDAALVAKPVTDRRLATLKIFDEEMVIVADAGHPAINSPKDVQKRTLLAFHPGCPHRSRLEEWFARAGVIPERIVELASYHLILGCAVAGMGVALLPRSVLETYSGRSRLSVHELGAKFRATQILLIWRKEIQPAKIAALIDVLHPKPAKPKTR